MIVITNNNYALGETLPASDKKRHLVTIFVTREARSRTKVATALPLRSDLSLAKSGDFCYLSGFLPVLLTRERTRCRMLTGCKNNYNYQEGGTIED
jgi:hypothetical protein